MEIVNTTLYSLLYLEIIDSSEFSHVSRFSRDSLKLLLRVLNEAAKCLYELCFE